MNISEILKHNFKKEGNLFLYDHQGNQLYSESSTGYWEICKYNPDGKGAYSSLENRIYFEDSRGLIIDDRPKTI